jgi:hypothetical protein
MANRTFSILPLSISMETLGGVATPLVLRGTPLPAKRAEVFSTASDEQQNVEVRLLLGERPLADDNTEIGVFHLKGIPQAKRGELKIRVEFNVGKNCAVTARAVVEGTRLSAEQPFPPPVELSDDFIEKKIAEALDAHKTDQAKLQNIEVTNKAKALLTEAENRLSQGSNATLNQKVAALGLALESRKIEDIKRKSDELETRLRSGGIFEGFGGFDFSNLFAPPQPAPKNSPQKSTPAKPAQQALATTGSQPPLGKIFGCGEFTLDPALCFVLMPFAQELKPVYEDHVKPVVERAGLQCERADEIRGTTAITRDIWERVSRARFLIADLTRQNANVFYELGLAHAIGKDVILLSQSTDFIPFDLKTIRVIVYDYTPRGVKKLEQDLANTIALVMKST